ncbi:RagB/SusD family nutrient uptake outer membrane protein [Algoriphagus sp. AGSA1]|uniref:RagB/SusD family nutrient uptake outer membrane protein n=1 Tax=Algoriphagus sp. AGSA1 TaxID=2907213 RepID=UPI001F28FCAD|nr:RagB/SusD family nutrient uptake outer membrane protein [Algoriphagus sp. AGSA1]MCE7053048.1 RagB/SusD family nutrient uptake outer membrane protein [Algoriphagus sp. AGSA1]
MKKYIIRFLNGVLLLSLVSCQDYLEEKPLKDILVPSTPEDVRALLDNYPRLNFNSLATFLISDDWEISSQKWNTMNPWEQNAYLWQKEVFEPTQRSVDYNAIHMKIFYSHICMDILAKQENHSSPEFSYLKGEALALRGRALFELAELFLPSPKSDLKDQIKIPVNLESDINATLARLGILEVLGMVKQDLEMAFTLLPEKQLYKTRPDKATVKAYLARVYLYEENWEETSSAAAYVVEHSEELLDYKALDASLAYPFMLFNKETVFYSVTSSYSVTASPESFINPELYQLYEENDRRKNLFFRLDNGGNPLYKGSLTGNLELFTGISLPEMYLTAAEGTIRTGNVENGLAYLNQLCANRYEDFVEWEDLGAEEALEVVLLERRKEQVFRGTRWLDMKRFWYLSQELKNEREIHGELYSLTSEEQFIWQVPPYEIELEGR